MASGQQLAEKNFLVFTAWLSSRVDQDFRQMVFRGVLSRKEIATQCGFALSALNQNPRIRAALSDKETLLRGSGVLPPLALGKEAQDERQMPTIRGTGSAASSVEVDRLRRLEQENASLKAENGQLKRELERYAVIREVLAETGRFPR